MIYIQKILGVAIVIVSAFVIHFESLNVVGVLGIVWGWDIVFNRHIWTFEPQKHTNRKSRYMYVGETPLVGIAGESLKFGDAVIFGEDGKIHKARSGQ